MRRLPVGLLVLALPFLVMAALLRRARTRDEQLGEGSSPAPATRRTAVVAPAAPAVEAAPIAAADTALEPAAPKRPRRRRRLVPGAGVIAVSLSLLALIGIPTTWAAYSKQITMQQVSVAGGQVDPPTALGAIKTPTAARVSWAAPSGGLVPDSYDIYRSTTAGSYGASLANAATSPYDDATAAECNTYFYKAASRRVNLTSALSPSESSVFIDRTPPTLGTNGAHILFDPDPLPRVPDFIRVSGGNVEVYAQVQDNCANGSDLTVTFNFGAPFNSPGNPATFGNYTPVGGGPTYNFRWTYALPASSMTHGAVLSWTVTATDPSGNSATHNATNATADGVGPTFGASPAELVSATTNYYDAAAGHGEIVSGSGNATLRTNGYWIYSNVTDASGVSSVRANSATITTGATATNLVEGTYSTDNGVTWNYRQATKLVPNTALADGATGTATITATDGLGNTSTNSPTVDIDNSAPTAATCTNAGNASNSLNVGDTTTWTITGTDTIDPASVKATWTAPPFTTTATATLANGTRDFFNLNGNFGLTAFAGTAYNQSWNMNATNWTPATFANSTFAIIAKNQMRLTYGTPSGTVQDRNSSAIAYFGTGLRNAAGYQLAGTITTPGCSTAAW